MNLAGWDLHRWGSTLIWDHQIVGLVARAARISPALRRILEQDPPTEVRVSAAIEIDGTDVSSLATDFRTTLRGNGGVSDAAIGFRGLPSVSLHQSVVSIWIRYEDTAGNVFETERFRGLAHHVDRVDHSTGAARNLTCYDLGYSLAELPVTLLGNNLILTGSGIKASDMINAQLMAQGFGPSAGTFVDWTLNGVVPNRFAYIRDLIVALAKGMAPCTAFMDTCGIMRFATFDEATAGPWNFPLGFQTFQEEIETASSRYNRVVVSSLSQSPVTYNDLADQAVPGRGITTGTASMAWNPSLADVQAFGQAIAKHSQRKRYSWGSPIQAFVCPGDNVTLYHPSGGSSVVRVEDVTDTGSAGSDRYWSQWFGRATAA